MGPVIARKEHVLNMIISNLANSVNLQGLQVLDCCWLVNASGERWVLQKTETAVLNVCAFSVTCQQAVPAHYCT